MTAPLCPPGVCARCDPQHHAERLAADGRVRFAADHGKDPR